MPMARSNPLGARQARILGDLAVLHGNEVEDENNEDVINVYVYIADQNNDRIQKFY